MSFATPHLTVVQPEYLQKQNCGYRLWRCD